MPMRSHRRSASSRLWVHRKIVRPCDLEFLDEVAHQFGRFRVQTAGGFVQKQHLRLVQQRAGDGQFLPHAFGKAANLVKAPVPTARACAGIFPPAREHPCTSYRLAKMRRLCSALKRSYMPGDFGQNTDGAADVLIILADLQRADEGAPGGRTDQAGEHAHGGGFTGAVWPEKAKNLALAHLECQILHRANSAVDPCGS